MCQISIKVDCITFGVEIEAGQLEEKTGIAFGSNAENGFYSS